MFSWHYSILFFHKISFTKVGGPWKFPEEGYFQCIPTSKSHQTMIYLFGFKPLMKTAELRIFLKVFLFLLPGSALLNIGHPQSLSSFFKVVSLNSCTTIRDWIIQKCWNWPFFIQRNPPVFYTSLSTWHLPILFWSLTHAAWCVDFLGSHLWVPLK